MGELRNLVGTREVSATLPTGTTVRDFIGWLTSSYGEALARRVLTPRGGLHPHVAVFLNGQDIRELQGLDTEMREGQVEMVILPVFEGGASTAQDTRRPIA